MNIYVNMRKKLSLNKNIIKIMDIADVEAPKSVKSKVLDLCILRKSADTYEIIDFNQIIEAIHKEYPDATVMNTGEKNTLVEFVNKTKKNLILDYTKILFVCMIIFAGASTAIMSFHSDAQLNEIFKKYTEIFLGKDGNVKIIEIAYSIGLASGIIVFFNHFGRRKFTDDPTPIQVEMSLYEDDVTKTMLNTIQNKKKE